MLPPKNIKTSSSHPSAVSSRKHCSEGHCGMPSSTIKCPSLSPDPPSSCPFCPHSATIPTHSISLWQVRLSFRTQKLPNKSKTWPCMQKNWNLKMSAKLHFTGTERDGFWYFYQLLIKISILQLNVFDQNINCFWSKYQILKLYNLRKI